MVRRRMTLRRIEPWSVLKFGFVANLSLLAIWMLGAAIVWFFIQQLGLIEKVCGIAQEVGFETCAVNGGNLFRALFLLGLLGVVVNTGLVVFLAFLHNLIADLVGGLSFSLTDETPGAASSPLTANRTAPVPVVNSRREDVTASEAPWSPGGSGSTPSTGATTRSGPPAAPRSGPSGERMFVDPPSSATVPRGTRRDPGDRGA